MPSSRSVAGTAAVHPHTFGTRALDSSGDTWVYVKASTVAIIGSLVFCAPGADPWQATIMTTGGVGISSVQGAMLGIQGCTANTTTQDCWIQVTGALTALLDTTAAAAGIPLFISTSIAGAMSVTTTGARLFGAYIQTTGGAGGTAPVVVTVNAPNGLLINMG